MAQAICNAYNRLRITSRLYKGLIQIKRKRQTTQQENVPKKEGKTKGQKEIKTPHLLLMREM